MEEQKLVDAVAYLSEQIVELRASQAEHNRNAEAALKTWNQTNLKLMETILLQAEDSSGFNQQQHKLSECLISLTHYIGELGKTASELTTSLRDLRKHLESEQSPQLLQLAENTSLLKTSSENLNQFIIGEQTERAKTLEEGMTSLILILEQIPDIEKVRALPLKKEVKKRGLNFDLSTLSLGNFSVPFATSLCTAVLLILFWQVSGIGNQITRAEERTIWSIMKLEKIESYFGI